MPAHMAEEPVGWAVIPTPSTTLTLKVVVLRQPLASVAVTVKVCKPAVTNVAEIVAPVAELGNVAPPEAIQL